MRPSSLPSPTRMFTQLLRGLLFAFLAVALPLGAQMAPESHAGRGFGPGYDATQEATLIGTIQEVVTQHVAGSPPGMHLLVADARGMVDVHVGSFLTKDVKEALHAGTPVQIVGATMQLHEKQYFLARELTVGGRTVTIRSARGFLIFPHADRLHADHPDANRLPASHQAESGVKVRTSVQPESNGGAR